MPERHSDGSSGGSSGSSSSSSSGGSSWSSSSSSSGWSSSGRYGNNGPRSPEEQAFAWAVLIIMGVIVAVIWIGGQIGKANDKRNNANATATTLAITAKDLAEMHTALDNRIVVWKQVTDRAVHHVSASEAGLDDGNTKEVLYGYCDTAKFYVYVLELSSPGGGYFADTEGYAFTPDSYPQGCHPNGFYIASDEGVGGGWHFVTIRTRDATFAAQATMTTIPKGTSTATPTGTPESKQ